MSDDVCCPSCWSWSELGKRTTCKQCGAPLILPDGRNVDTLRSQPPPPPPPPAAFAPSGLQPAATPAGFPAPLYHSAISTTGTDWVAICRWITLGYGVLCALTLIAVGLLVRHLNIPITDPNTGIVTVQTFDIGAAFAIAAIMTLAVFALFAWLTKFTLARVIFLLFDVLAIFNVIGGAGSIANAGSLWFLSVGSLLLDAVYGGALLMSLLQRPPQPAYG
jgi:hypothetical protein